MTNKTPVILLHVLGLLLIVAGCADIEDDIDGLEIPMGSSQPAPVPGSGPVPGPAPAPNPVPRILKIDAGEPVPALGNKDATTVPFPFSVRVGEVIRISPHALQMEAFRQETPAPNRSDRVVCVETKSVCVSEEPIYERRCSNHNYPCVKCDFFGCRPWICSEQRCENVQVGTRCTATTNVCVRSENQWIESLDYPKPVSWGLKTLDPVTISGELFLNGIAFVFTDPSVPSKSLRCPISALPWSAEGDTLVIPIHSNPNCDLVARFGENRSLSFSIVNTINRPETFKVGREVKNWKDEITEKAQALTVSSEFTFQGTIEVEESSP